MDCEVAHAGFHRMSSTAAMATWGSMYSTPSLSPDGSPCVRPPARGIERVWLSYFHS